MKKKVVFMAPETKGGPYYIYKEMVECLKKKYGKELDIYFFHSKKDWFKLHFNKYDVIFSVIPFLFKPLKTKKYFYNLHGNFKIEKKRKGLGNKLLYLARLNLSFCDKIILTSYFLSDKLDFRKKYKNKIEILPNFVEEVNYKRPKTIFKENDIIKLLTVSSTKFLEKGMGILDLGKEVAKIKKKIKWTIIAGGDQKNMEKIQKEFYQINFPKNIKIKRLDRVEKDKLNNYYKKNDIFIYGTRLDTWGITVLEAMSFDMPIMLLKYESFEYIFDKDYFILNIKKDLDYIIKDYNKIILKQKAIFLKYSKKSILEKTFYLIKDNT